MNAAKEKLITSLIDARIQNIRNNGAEEEWMADAMNFGWIGYDKHTNEELIYEAKMLDIEDVPTLDELNAPET